MKCLAFLMVTDLPIQSFAKKLNETFTHIEQTLIFKGTVAQRGYAGGKALVLPMMRNHEEIAELDKRMRKGDILIAETTSPDIMSLCHKAAAIVTDQGGMLSHAAVISREFGIPCVIGTNRATEIIKTGDLIEVDAEK